MFPPSSPTPRPEGDPPAPQVSAARDTDDLDWDLNLLPVADESKRRPASIPAAPRKAQNDPPVPESKRRPGTRLPIGRKSGDATKAFTRLITRPGTTVAVHTVSDTPAANRAMSSHLPAAGASLGKHKSGEDVGYSPNRLQTVMNDTWAYSPPTWPDHLSRVRLIVITTLSAGIVGVLLWRFGWEIHRQQESLPAGAASADELASPEVRQAAIHRAFAAFLAAPGMADKLPFILDPERVESRMKDFYVTRREQDPPIASWEVGPPVQAAGAWWFTLSCLAPDGTRSTAVMKETAAGGQLDWENFVAYGSMPWGQFHTTRPAAPQSIRARLRPSPQYAGKYTKEDYFAYEIAHRSGPPVIFGYIPRSSRTAQLLAAVPSDDPWQPANLYLCWEPDAGASNCVSIAGVIRNNWLDTIPSNSSAPAPASVPPADSIPP